MKCSKCGNEIPSQSKFCLSCGQAVSVAKPETPAAPPAPNKKSGVWGAVAGLGIVALLIILGLWSHGRVTQAPRVPSPQQTPILRGPAPPNSPQAGVLQTDVNKPPLKSPGKPQAPAEVIAYLEHLKKVDNARQALQEKEIGTLMAAAVKAQAGPLEQMLKMTDPDAKAEDINGTGQFKAATDQLNSDWQRLAQFFLSVQAPEQCKTLAGDYYEALRETVKQMGQVNDKLSNLDVSGLYAMKGKSTVIDDKLDSSEKELGTICDRYGIQKGFSIKSDRGSGGNVTSFPGL